MQIWREVSPQTGHEHAVLKSAEVPEASDKGARLWLLDRLVEPHASKFRLILPVEIVDQPF